MGTYYTGSIKHLPMSQATTPYRWTRDGSMCVGSNGVPVFGVACGGQPRPALNCPPGYVQGGIGSRFCTPEYNGPTPGVPYPGQLRNLGPGWVDPDRSNHDLSFLNVLKSDLSIGLSQQKLKAPTAPRYSSSPAYPSTGNLNSIVNQLRQLGHPSTQTVLPHVPSAFGASLSPSSSSGVGLDPQVRDALVLIGATAILVVMMKR